MSWNKKNTGGVDEAALDDELVTVLKNFKQSVRAWSQAAYSRPRTEMGVVAHGGWQLATAWALGCVLATGGLGAGLYEHHRQVALARVKATEEAHQRLLAVQEERARQADEQLLATVDSDISRTVPAAMEPLAQLMDEGQGQ